MIKNRNFLSIIIIFILTCGCNNIELTQTTLVETPPSPFIKTPTYTYAYQRTTMAEMKENLNADIYGWYYTEVTPASELADFLIIVYPPPGATIPNDPDKRPITIMFWGDDIDQGCAKVGEEIYERFKIFVDDSLMTRDQLRFQSMLEIGVFLEPNGEVKCTFDNGPFSISAYADLNEGRHSVKFMITRNTGEVLEYEWEFDISR